MPISSNKSRALSMEASTLVTRSMVATCRCRLLSRRHYCTPRRRHRCPLHRPLRRRGGWLLVAPPRSCALCGSASCLAVAVARASEWVCAFRLPLPSLLLSRSRACAAAACRRLCSGLRAVGRGRAEPCARAWARPGEVADGSSCRRRAGSGRGRGLEVSGRVD